MPTVVVASHNPVKLRAVERGFSRMLPDGGLRFEAVTVESGVGRQPGSDEETLQGARDRARRAARARPGADFWVGIEGGIEDTADGMCAFAWIVVLSPARSGRARTATFFLPEPVARRVRAGEELGEADDRVFGRRGSKREEGAVGLLTGNVVDRTELYAHGVSLALVPFRNRELYPEDGGPKAVDAMGPDGAGPSRPRGGSPWRPRRR